MKYNTTMNDDRWLFLFFTLFIPCSALGQYGATPICLNKGNYTSDSTYSLNLNAVVSSLSMNIDGSGFYSASVGQGEGRAYAVSLCRSNVELNTCRQCVELAGIKVIKTCPNQKQAIQWEEECMVRYSNETINGVLEMFPGWFGSSGGMVRDQGANGGSLRKMAAGSVVDPGSRVNFAQLECTPDLSPQNCTICLAQAMMDVRRRCNGWTACTLLRPSCNLRFHTDPIFKETSLQVTILPVPSPSPSPPWYLLPPLPPTPTPSPSPPSIAAPPIPPPEKGGGGNHAKLTLIFVVVPISIVMIIIAVLAIVYFKRKKNKKPMEYPDSQTANDIYKGELVQYAFSTIRAATNEFSDSNKLGQGGFGTVYKGELPNGQEIAVKRLSRDSRQGDSEFKNEVMLLAKLQHRNLVRLLGFALEGMERLLIYEFVHNASLNLSIFDPINRQYLNWDKRYKIILGIARGILYLHEDSRLRIVHRDLKTSNVLLDKEMNPKIADFGMARLFELDETQGNTSKVVGTYGYMSPEYLLHGQFSNKSDVFSFGVVLLEIVSGRRNASFPSGGNAEGLLSFAWRSWRSGSTTNVVDPLLFSNSGASGSMGDMLRCIHIGLLCVQDNADDRPTMASVVLMLSSSSITMVVPSEPAFYLTTKYGSNSSQLYEYNSRHPHSSSASRPNLSGSSTHNDASNTITHLHPRD